MAGFNLAEFPTVAELTEHMQTVTLKCDIVTLFKFRALPGVVATNCRDQFDALYRFCQNNDSQKKQTIQMLPVAPGGIVCTLSTSFFKPKNTYNCTCLKTALLLLLLNHAREILVAFGQYLKRLNLEYSTLTTKTNHLYILNELGILATTLSRAYALVCQCAVREKHLPAIVNTLQQNQHLPQILAYIRIYYTGVIGGDNIDFVMPDNYNVFESENTVAAPISRMIVVAKLVDICDLFLKRSNNIVYNNTGVWVQQVREAAIARVIVLYVLITSRELTQDMSLPAPKIVEMYKLKQLLATVTIAPKQTGLAMIARAMQDAFSKMHEERYDISYGLFEVMQQIRTRPQWHTDSLVLKAVEQKQALRLSENRPNSFAVYIPPNDNNSIDTSCVFLNGI